MTSSKQFIKINNWQSVSALGASSDSVQKSYYNNQSLFSQFQNHSGSNLVSRLDAQLEAELQELRSAHKNYSRLDRVVLLALLSARKLMLDISLENLAEIGINIGSSRGATGLWESYYSQFSQEKHLSPYCSPTTTAGNLSSWVARDLASTGLAFSHSVTCSTGLHAILNAIAWLKAGFSKRVIAGGAEAALTPFSLAQMEALGIYTNRVSDSFPCLALGRKNVNENTFVLGEGCALFDLSLSLPDQILDQDIVIEGFGFANEITSGATSISSEGSALQLSMQRALAEIQSEIDVVVTHAPGTYLGDAAELQACAHVFSAAGQAVNPVLVSNKHIIGHTFAASGPLSLEFAIQMLRARQVFVPPYEAISPELAASWQKAGSLRPRRILVSATGFGGNAVSLVVTLGQYLSKM
jgi:3-oxoacyl-[acyl-carrier-protein] synthase II